MQVSTPLRHRRTVLMAMMMAFALSASPRASAEDDAAQLSDEPPPSEQFDSAMIDRGPLADAAELSPKQVFSYLDLDDPPACGALEDRDALARRTEQWREATYLLHKSSPKMLRRWIIGRRRPPQAVRRAARKQLHCMFDALFKAAAEPDSDFHVDVFADEDESLASGSPAWVRRYNRNAYWRGRIRARLLRSYIRRAPAQARIWVEKYEFHTDAFGIVSKQAGDECDITAGRGWHPSWPDHRSCWLNTLTGREREREILQTSSAPGISRHHWGTEFDVFTLRPASWEKGELFYEEYQWLSEHALDFGFFQPYHGPNPENSKTYIEERWHWSYYPAATALTDHIRDHRDDIHDALVDQWSKLAARHRDRPRAKNPKDVPEKKRVAPYFRYIRDHWFAYATGIVEPEVE